MRIRVTATDLRLGWRSRGVASAVASALGRAHAGRRVRVEACGGGHAYWIDGRGPHPLPPQVSGRIAAGGRGEPVGPFDADLTS